MLDSIKKLRQKLEKEVCSSSKVFIVGHNGPDFDAIGSAIGLYTFAVANGKEAYIIVDDDPSKIEPGVKKIISQESEKYNIIPKTKYLELADKKSLLIVTDTSKQPMISVGDSLDRVRKVIVIDHHTEDETTIATKSRYISQKASSACEIVSRVLHGGKIIYGPDVANYLLAGISLDTRRFMQNTTGRTHEEAERLIKHGAKVDAVNNLFLEEFEDYCRIRELIINGTVIRRYTSSQLNPLQVAFTLNRNNTTKTYVKEDLAKASDRMIKFTGVDAAFALGFIEDGVIHISARSGRRIDVSKVMMALSGGGTAQSAGARIEGKDILRVERELRQKVYCGISDDEENIESSPRLVKMRHKKRKERM